MYELGKSKGYEELVCSNIAGCNLLFVRKDKIKNLNTLTPNQAYVKSQFRHTRDNKGNLSYISVDQRFSLSAGMKVYNVITQSEEAIGPN